MISSRMMLALFCFISVVVCTAQGSFHDQSFDEIFFKTQMEKSMSHVRQLLESSKQPTFVSEVSHEYQDKYLVVEFMLNTALSAVSNILSTIGVTPAHHGTMIEWARTHSVSLRFDTIESCEFDRQVVREDQDGKTVRVEVTSDAGGTTRHDRKTVFNVTEYYWNYSVNYKLLACKGVGDSAEDCIVFSDVAATEVLVVQGNAKSPRSSRHRPSILSDLTVYLRAYPSAKSLRPVFSINRNTSTCFTPRRNDDVKQLLDQMEALQDWAGAVGTYLSSTFPKRDTFATIGVDEVFVPILPVLMDCSRPGVSEEECVDTAVLDKDGSPNTHPRPSVPSSHAMSRLLGEQLRTLHKLQAYVESTCSNASIASAGQLFVATAHLKQLCSQSSMSVQHIEALLRQQLVAAIGKEVHPVDIAAFMAYAGHKLFAEQFQPQALSYAVRRSGQHSPEGRVAVEVKYPRVAGSGRIDTSSYDMVNNAPIYTSTQRRHRHRAEPVGTKSGNQSASAEPVVSGLAEPLMRFNIDSSTTIALHGDLLVHSYLQPRFSAHENGHVHFGEDTIPELFLTAEARQFSSFIVLIGRISSASTFEPTAGLVVKNKDTLRIPLQLAVIPTEREFRDAIESLSHEQQQFARAFRGMQMQHTLFGVCVVQIKPQLEKVLNLPPDSLTKEIALTEDLMELFIEYQIPSDLLAAERTAMKETEGRGGLEGGLVTSAITEVKANVGAIQAMISRAKAKELEDKKMADEMMDRVKVKHYTERSERERSDDVRLHRVLRGASGVSFMAAIPEMIEPTSYPSGLFAAEEEAAGRSAPSSSTTSIPQESTAPLETKTSQRRDSDRRTLEEDSAIWYDVTSLPNAIQEEVESKAQLGSLIRPSIITPGDMWTMQSHANLFAGASTRMISIDQQRAEKLKTFGLLDALTKSGALQIDGATIHVIVASVHMFDENVMDTIVQSNINPIEKLEISGLLLASVVHRAPVEELVKNSDVLDRVRHHFPSLDSSVKA